MIILHGNKKLNVKVSKGGKFQITGCKDIDLVQSGLLYFLKLVRRECPQAVTGWSETLSIQVRTVMTNIVFDIGFCIDKAKLTAMLHQVKNCYNLFETNFGYTGMNIKIPLPSEAYHIHLPELTLSGCSWNVNVKPFTLASKKKKYNTFLVFHSGKVIMSGMVEENMKRDFEFFHSFLLQHRKNIEEKIIL